MIEIKHIDKAPENGRFVLLDDGKEIEEMTTPERIRRSLTIRLCIRTIVEAIKPPS